MCFALVRLAGPRWYVPHVPDDADNADGENAAAPSAPLPFPSTHPGLARLHSYLASTEMPALSDGELRGSEGSAS